MKTIIVLTAALAATTLLGGCSQKSEVDALKARVAAVEQVATDAKNMATANRQAVQQNTASAQTAIETASVAKTSSEEANSKIDSMFKRSMYK